MKISLFLNHRCNLRCAYCYTGRKFERRMGEETARRAIDFGLERAEQGWLLLAFFGGEPLLEIDLMEEACRYLESEAARRGKRTFFTVATNGTLLDDRRVALLERLNFDVQVSMDGGPEAQDACRRFADGRSTFSEVETGVRRLLERRRLSRVIAVIDPSTVGFLGASFEHLADLGVPHIHFSPNYLGSWDGAARERVQNAVADLADRWAARVRRGQVVRVDPIYGKIVSHLSPGTTQRAACKFGLGDLAVAPSGRIYPCERLVGEDDGSGLCLGDLDRGLDEPARDAMLARMRIPDPERERCPVVGQCKRWCGCAAAPTSRPAAIPCAPHP
jgi:uncharacterized protein